MIIFNWFIWYFLIGCIVTLVLQAAPSSFLKNIDLREFLQPKLPDPNQILLDFIQGILLWPIVIIGLLFMR